MPELGRYKKLPRSESRETFLRYLKNSPVVQDVIEVSYQVIVVKRKRKSPIKSFLTNVYIVSLADVYEITAENPDIKAIVTMSAWNGYTREAKDHCVQRGIGLFRFSEFFGAVYYDGKAFLSYTPPERH